jgi:ArsR family transcriptional regulator
VRRLAVAGGGPGNLAFAWQNGVVHVRSGIRKGRTTGSAGCRRASNSQATIRGAVFYTSSFAFPRTIVNKDDIFTLIDRHEHIETAARALKAIAHPLRLKILCVLGDTEVCVQDIVDAVGTSQSNISQHLAILRDKGVLQTRKDANRVFYRVGDQRTLQLIVLMREVFCSDKPGN